MPKALFVRCLLVILCALSWTACTVHKTEAPGLSGPSEFALSFGVTATPDSISQDGGSQSTIVVRAFDANGTPKPQVTFRLDMRVSGQSVDYGTLSGKTLVTGLDGRASAVYTAPPALPPGANLASCSPSIFNPALPGGCVEILATPVGTGFSSALSQSVDIHLIPLGVILPPAATPTAQFTFTPTAPAANTPVQFDASTSCGGQTNASGGCAAGDPSSYTWEFSDGGTASGRLASHTFALAQTYSVTLTVTNDRGIKASSTKSVTVGSGSSPTASFVFSPTPVVVGAEVFFDASNSRPGLGHRIASYQWNWGDNESTSPAGSPLQEHDYQAAGTYTVLLTVTDDTGQVGTTTQTVSVSTGAPVADFSFVVENPATHRILFDARSSSALGGATVASYSWIFGDGSTDTGATPSHVYATAGTFTVRLTVTDSVGKTGVVSKSVTVP